jgi:hypothetical protein
LSHFIAEEEKAFEKRKFLQKLVNAPPHILMNVTFEGKERKKNVHYDDYAVSIQLDFVKR